MITYRLQVRDGIVWRGSTAFCAVEFLRDMGAPAEMLIEGATLLGYVDPIYRFNVRRHLTEFFCVDLTWAGEKCLQARAVDWDAISSREDLRKCSWYHPGDSLWTQVQRFKCCTLYIGTLQQHRSETYSMRLERGRHSTSLYVPDKKQLFACASGLSALGLGLGDDTFFDLRVSLSPKAGFKTVRISDSVDGFELSILDDGDEVSRFDDDMTGPMLAWIMRNELSGVVYMDLAPVHAEDRAGVLLETLSVTFDGNTLTESDNLHAVACEDGLHAIGLGSLTKPATSYTLELFDGPVADAICVETLWDRDYFTIKSSPGNISRVYDRLMALWPLPMGRAVWFKITTLPSTVLYEAEFRRKGLGEHWVSADGAVLRQDHLGYNSNGSYEDNLRLCLLTGPCEADSRVLTRNTDFALLNEFGVSAVLWSESSALNQATLPRKLLAIITPVLKPVVSVDVETFVRVRGAPEAPPAAEKVGITSWGLGWATTSTENLQVNQ